MKLKNTDLQLNFYILQLTNTNLATKNTFLATNFKNSQRKNTY